MTRTRRRWLGAPAGSTVIASVSDEVERLGVPMRLVERSDDAAQHAAEIGLIAPDDAEAAASAAEEQRAETWWERLLGGRS